MSESAVQPSKDERRAELEANLEKLKANHAQNVPSQPAISISAKSATNERPPKCELQGNKWSVENQTSNLHINPTSINENVYIYNCKNATIFVDSKCKGITIDKCTRCNVVAEKLITTCEFIGSKNCKFQIKHVVPTVSFDKSDDCTLILSQESLGVQIISSKSAECNVMWPKEDSDDWVEQPIPSQFYHSIKGDKIETVVSDLYN